NNSDTSDPFTLGALPLNLISFTAQKTPGDKITLQWSMGSEQNIAGYTVLRKRNNETVFSSISFIRSKAVNGISNTQLDYSFTDSATPDNSKLFYRLLIQNVDGSYTYSDIRTIIPGKKNNFIISPNPSKGHVQIFIGNFTQPIIMALYDNSGKKVKEQELHQQTTIIGLSGLRGIYIMQLSYRDGTNVTRKKLIVE
ncbi:MAG: T9SS type A sorting domain-containing protein, partial [Ginsengibacter sp.]